MAEGHSPNGMQAVEISPPAHPERPVKHSSMKVAAFSSATWANDADFEALREEEERKATGSFWAFVGLAWGSLGVVYGDLGTSPLYLWPSVFTSQPSADDVIGATSIILWTLTLIVVLKYVAIVLNANDHGEGGTFAIYSLLCRFARINPVGNVESGDRSLRRYTSSQGRIPIRAGGQVMVGNRIAMALEKQACMRALLLNFVLLGTCALIGDGILTPAISVVSAISGLQVPQVLLDDQGNPKVSNGAVVGISCLVLVLIFVFQRLGTSRIGSSYAPILLLWFICNAAVGCYNIATSHPAIFRALSPHYIFLYFIRNRYTGWYSLGGMVLAITDMSLPSNLPALFADLGHFSIWTIRASALGVVYPSLVLIYLGQAAYLMQNPGSYSSLYYSSIPTPVYWPMFILALLASIVASQSIITGTFSIISQSMTLNCFPRVRIVHTSSRVRGQIYIPEVNWCLMTVGVALILGFTLTQPGSAPVNTAELGNAFGVAVLSVMLVTTVLVSLVMLVVWEKPVWLVLPFFLFYFVLEGLYFSATIFKVPKGAWFPLALTAAIMGISMTWHHSYIKTLRFHRQHAKQLSALITPQEPASGRSNPSSYTVTSSGVAVSRLPGLAVYYTDTLKGLPQVFEQLLATAPTLHRVIVFLHIRQVPVPAVHEDERLLVKHLEFPGFYRVVARYGYVDRVDQGAAFIAALLQQLELEQRVLIASQTKATKGAGSPELARAQELLADLAHASTRRFVYFRGRATVHAKPGTNWFQKLILERAYGFLRMVSRSPVHAFRIPAELLLEVGLQYEV